MTAFRKPLTDDDEKDWAAYAGTVKPLRGTDAAPEAPVPGVPPAPRPRAPLAAKPQSTLRVGDAPAGLDRASWQRLRTGRMAPERMLDLHGRTAQHAFHALQSFLHAAAAEGVRCVEIITGRGSGEAGGVLRRELPHWLNRPELRRLILAASHPHTANPGAVRLLLRRPRA